MSELINNREERKKVLKELIKELHQGKTVDDVKDRFNQLIKNIGAKEIAEMEEALIQEGVEVSEVKRLCDVHVAVFKESLEEAVTPDTIPGHPIYTFKQENRAVEKVIDLMVLPTLEQFKSKEGEAQENLLKLREAYGQLADLDKHYSRKENLLFPYLEKYEFTGPTSVMWGIDDDIRRDLKEVIQMAKEAFNTGEGDLNVLIKNTEELIEAIQSMIYKEENILFPTAFELLTEEEWGNILEESHEIGYCLIEPEKGWKPNPKDERAKEEIAESKTPSGYLKFNTGILKLEEISAIFNHLPIDITYVDKDNIVKFFSEGERIFTRTKAIIGRRVENCHPPSSVHVVEKIVKDFEEGIKDHVDFWIQMNGMFIYIQYFAVRDEKGNFMGTLEVSQNIAKLRALEGEKRLLDE